MSIPNLCIALAGLATIAACAPTVEQRGNLPASDKIAEIHPGTTTKDQVAEILGMQGASIRSVVQRGLGDNASLVMVLHPLLESRFYAAVRLIGRLDFMRSAPRAIRVIEEEFT